MATAEKELGTRWPLAIAGLLLGFLLLGAMLLAMRSPILQAFSAQLVIQKGSGSFSADRIVAQDAAFGTAMVDTSADSTTAWRPVLRAGFASASIYNFCFSKTEKIPVLGASWTIFLRGGKPGESTPSVTANSAAFDVTKLRSNSDPGILLQGSAQIGLSTTDLTTLPGTAPYTSDPFGVPPDFDPNWYTASVNGGRDNGQGYTGIDATKADLSDVYGDIWQAQIEGDISLKGMQISVVAGATSCEEETTGSDSGDTGGSDDGGGAGDGGDTGDGGHDSGDPSTSSDGPATIVGVASNYAETNNTNGEGLGSILDGLPATKWYTAHNTVYATYTLSQPYKVTSYTVTSGNDSPDRDPYDFTLQGSNDNSSWTTVDTVTGNRFAARNTAYSFSVDDPGTFKYYKLNVTKTAGTSNNGGGSAFQISEWTLGDVGLSSSAASANAGSGKESYRFLIDGDPATKWFSGSFAKPSITYTMNSPTKAITYTLTTAADSSSYSGRNPKDWTVQGSNDNSTWTTLDTQTSQSFSGNNAKKTYTIAGPQAYKYYRLSVTAVSSGSDIQLADWTLGTGTG